MEVKQTNLRRYFIIYVVKLCTRPFVMIAALFIFGVLAIHTGLLQNANHQELQIIASTSMIEEAEQITSDLMPEGVKFALLSKDGTTVLDSGTMNETEVKQAIKFLQTGVRQFGFDNSAYHIIRTEDTICIVQYSLIAKFSIPILDVLFPYPWMMGCIICIVAYILYVIALRRKSTLSLQMELNKLLTIVAHIEKQDLEFSCDDNYFEEFQTINDVLDYMRNELKSAVQKQISIEQAKNWQISALAHDIKIPITIIRGNSELLLILKHIFAHIQR